MPCIICTDIGSSIKKINECANNIENFSTIKIGQHVFMDIQWQRDWILII